MASSLRDPRSILITGGSSGLGEALAKAYAGPGRTLALLGRDQARLATVSEACRAKGATVSEATIDVTEQDRLAAWIARVDQAAPLDLAIANAGVSAGTGAGGEDADQTRHIFSVNLDGVLNSLLPVIDLMRPRGHGQIAITSSLAGFRGFPGAPAYCASKAAVRIWGEAQRGHLAAEGIAVNIICPGFIRTRMTAVNPYPMPLLMDAERAAEIIRRSLARNKARITFPWPLTAAIWLLAAAPPVLTDRLLRRLPEKT